MSSAATTPTTMTRSSPWRRRIIVALIIALALILWTGRTHPAGPANGISLNNNHLAKPATRPVIRVATLNIHAGLDSRDPARLSDVAKSLQNFDVVGLNEVVGRRPWRNYNQAQMLANQLSAPYLFAPSEREWWCDHFGNAIFCRLPVRRWERTPLSASPRRQPKCLVVSEVELGQAVVTVLVTHLDHAKDQGSQLKEVADRFLSAKGPAVLMGDLNVRPADGPLRELLAKPGVVDALSSVLQDRAPGDRVDWILCKGARVLDSGLVDTGASDHPLVWAELAVDLHSDAKQ